MKKFTLLSTIILAIFVMFISTPVLAFVDEFEECCPEVFVDIDTEIKNSKIQGALGEGNIGLQTNGSIHHNVIKTGDDNSKKGINDNHVNRSGILSGNTNSNLSIATKGGKIYNGDIDKSVDVDVKIKDNNTQLGVQNGRNNTAINGDNLGTIDNSFIHRHHNHTNSHNDNRKNYKNHSGNSHNSGIIEQSKNNSGIIVNQQQNGSGGRDDYGQGSGGDNVVIATIDNSIHEDKREHHTGTPVTFASLGTYAESKFAGSNFQTVEMMTMFKDTFSYEGALEVYGKPFGRGLCETVGKSYNGRHEDDPSAEIKVFTMDDKIIPGSVEAIGFLTVIGKEGKDATSFVVMQKCILSAAIMKGDAILVTKQGAETVTKSSGWGIGFNTSGSQINDNTHGRGNSYAMSGGTGWSTGKGKLEVLPWMVVQVLKFK